MLLQESSSELVQVRIKKNQTLEGQKNVYLDDGADITPGSVSL